MFNHVVDEADSPEWFSIGTRSAREGCAAHSTHSSIHGLAPREAKTETFQAR